MEATKDKKRVDFVFRETATLHMKDKNRLFFVFQRTLDVFDIF